MAIQDMAALQRGDVVIVEYGGQNAHTMIVTQRLDGNGTRDSYRVAHCPGPNAATREELLSAVCPPQDVADGQLFAWHQADNDVAGRAADLATYWSTQHHTLYGDQPGPQVALNASRARRNPKLHHGQTAPNKALRQVSNVASSDQDLAALENEPDGADQMWGLVVSAINFQFGGYPDWWHPHLDEVLTRAMKLEAKYPFTMVLKHQLGVGQSGWLPR